MLRPRSFEHIGIVVTDLDQTLRFYVDGLGLKLLRRKGEGLVGSAALKAGQVEINVFSNPAAETGRLQRIDHLCLSMESATIDALIAALGEAGIPVASSPVRRSDGIALFVRDPDGIRVELLVKE
jgi:catechol 2,3-dioxygenase-like lactoylglutathione lyase family enzyme